MEKQKSDEEMWDEICHSMQNELNLQYLRKMNAIRRNNLLGFALFCMIVGSMFIIFWR